MIKKCLPHFLAKTVVFDVASGKNRRLSQLPVNILRNESRMLQFLPEKDWLVFSPSSGPSAVYRVELAAGDPVQVGSCLEGQHAQLFGFDRDPIDLGIGGSGGALWKSVAHAGDDGPTSAAPSTEPAGAGEPGGMAEVVRALEKEPLEIRDFGERAYRHAKGN